jgi:hypothetical protein
MGRGPAMGWGVSVKKEAQIAIKSGYITGSSQHLKAWT